MAGGGGFSRLFPRPAYQDGIAGIGATRGVPDVAADADYRPGMAIAFSGGKDYVLGVAALASPLRCGPLSSPWPTSTPATTSASSIPPSTGSATAPTTTKRFTT